MDPYELIVLIIIAFPFLYIYYFTRRKIKIFKVYRHKTRGYSAVKDGLAWLAPALNPLWFFHRGLWSIFFIYISLFFFGALIHTELYGDLIMIPPDLWTERDYIWIITITIVFYLFPLIKGNDWSARNLIKKGYLFEKSVGAATKKNAIAIVLANKAKTNEEHNDFQPVNTSRANDKSPGDITLYNWVQVITVVVFIIMIFNGVDFITTITASLVILAGLSGILWVTDKAGSSPRNFELGYALVSIIAFAILGFVLYLNYTSSNTNAFKIEKSSKKTTYIPSNAYAYGNGFKCINGYKKTGSTCEKLTWQDGDFWKQEVEPGKSRLMKLGELMSYYGKTPNQRSQSDMYSNTINSRIEDEFEGYEYGNLYELTNGQVWQQISPTYRYSYKYRPKVTIRNGYMFVEGMSESIKVQRY